MVCMRRHLYNNNIMNLLHYIHFIPSNWSHFYYKNLAFVQSTCVMEQADLPPSSLLAKLPTLLAMLLELPLERQ